MPALDEDKLRFRLRFSSGIVAGTSQYLLRYPANSTVDSFLEEVGSRFALIRDVELVCSIGGFALPPCEPLRQVLRDDEIVTVTACRGKAVAHGGRKRKRTSQHPAPPAPPLSHLLAPCVDPWQAGSGNLLAALRVCGAVFVRIREDVFPDGVPDFPAWHRLWRQATEEPTVFYKRGIVRSRQLRFSKGEDLLRTRVGEGKTHTPDVRYNFGLGKDALRSKAWGDLGWIPEDFGSRLSILAKLIKEELSTASSAHKEPSGTLVAKVLSDCESWAGSRLRHSVYPAEGSCAEHTDYGVVTLQQSTGLGLEFYSRGFWQPLEPPSGFAVLFAGDMLEILTNGEVPALVHRVSPGDVRQSHIIFLQPDRETLVQPLQSCLRNDGTDFPAVFYGEWHQTKTSLAFRGKKSFTTFESQNLQKKRKSEGIKIGHEHHSMPVHASDLHLLLELENLSPQLRPEFRISRWDDLN